jgi:hypothetical protein
MKYGFKDLIRVTKIIEREESNEKCLLEFIDTLGELTDVCLELFSKANSGDDLFLVSGRNFGDDDDAVSVVLAPDQAAALERFVAENLGEELAEDESDDARYFIVTNTPITRFLHEHYTHQALVANDPLNLTYEKDLSQFEKRPSEICLGDVCDTWELVRILNADGEPEEQILAVFQTESQIDHYISTNGIKTHEAKS